MKLISLNIEGDKHLPEVIRLLQQESADIVCLQEVFEADLEEIQEKVDLENVEYVPLMKIESFPNIASLAPKGKWGIAILSKNLPIKTDAFFYVGSDSNTPVFENSPNSNNRAVLVAQINIEGSLFTVATTHLTWAKATEVSTLQLKHADLILDYLNQFADFILCGDFNAPRELPTYKKLADRLIDHLPSTITSTIDPNLHRVKGLSLVVDSVFSTPHYSLTDMKVVSDVSDHKALIASILKKN